MNVSLVLCVVRLAFRSVASSCFQLVHLGVTIKFDKVDNVGVMYAQ